MSFEHVGFQQKILLWKYSRSSHHVWGGKWHLQVLGKHLQCCSTVVKPYFAHKDIPQKKLQGQMLFQAESDQVTACESPRVEYFFSVHRRTSPAWVQTGYPSEMGVFFLCHALPAKISSPAWNNTCPETIKERFGFPDKDFLPWILPTQPWRLTKGGLKEAFSPELGHLLGETHVHSLTPDFPVWVSTSLSQSHSHLNLTPDTSPR